MRPTIRFVPVFSLLLFSPLFADEYTVLDSFNRAKFAAESEKTKFQQATSNWFETQESKAQRRGDKDALDGVKRLRQLFEKHEILAPNAPRELHKKQQSYREKMLLAFDDAIAGYTKLKQDALASKKQMERQQFESQIRHLPFGTWELRYFPGPVLATTTISDDLRSFHVDTIGRKEAGEIDLTEDGVTIRYPKFVEVWRPTSKGDELNVKHYFPASSFPEGTATHEAIGTRKQKR